jgi:hypothetical protein
MGTNGPRCTVCEHADRASIELGLANRVPIRVLGKRYNVHHDAIHRHGHRHMSPELHAQLMTRGRMTPIELENLKVTESEGLLQNLIAVRGRLYGLMDAAELQGDYKGAASIGGIVLKNLEVTARLLGDLKTGSVSVTNNVLVMPEFHALRTSIMQALRAHPDARADVVKALRQFESPELPSAETPEERAEAEPELAKARAATRSARAKRVINGEARRVDPGP